MNKAPAQMILDNLTNTAALKEKAKVCLYGAGGGGENLRKCLAQARPDVSVLCYIDTFKEGYKDGLPIYRLDTFAAQKIDYDSILIASLHGTEMAEQLQQAGCTTYKLVDPYLLRPDIQWDQEFLSFQERIDRLYSEKTISFADRKELPEIDVAFTVCGKMTDSSGILIDLVDFQKKNIRRWTIPAAPLHTMLEHLKLTIPEDRLPGSVSHRNFVTSQMPGPHTCHISPQEKLFTINTFYQYILNMETGEVALIPVNFAETPQLYAASGGFSPDYQYWYFARWPLTETIELKNGERSRVNCEIGRIRISDNHCEIIYSLEYYDEIHQLTASPDNRFLVLATFRKNLRVPYPDESMEANPEGYRKSHEAGIECTEMVTIDLAEGRHWFSKIPVPLPGHFEFDLQEPNTFYVSAHNMGINKAAAVIIEGPAAIFKMEIGQQQTVIRDSYSDKDFFRITQHMPFAYEGEQYLAVTTIPNKLDIIAVKDMSLWRRIELFPFPPLDFSGTGNACCPNFPDLCLCVNPSRDGRYIVLESRQEFLVYDLKEDRILPARVPLYLPENVVRVSHTRIIGR